MLRRATDDDRDAILTWRNHPEVRAASLTKHVISPEEHAAWWERTVGDPSRRLLVYERLDVPSGSVLFSDIDPATHSASWGFYLDVAGLEARGHLLPAWLEIERDAIRYAFDDLGLQVLHGEVLAANEGVRALNRRHRIREVGTYERETDDGGTERVVRLELRAEDARPRTAAAAEGTVPS